MHRGNIAFGFLIATIVLLGCGKKSTDSGFSSGETQLDSALSCTATPDKTEVAVEEVLTVTINISGGTPPYSIPGYVTDSAQTTWVFQGTFSEKNAGKTLTRQVPLSDQVTSTTCNFEITVLP